MLFVFGVSLSDKFDASVSSAAQDVFHLEQMLQILVSILCRSLLIVRLCHQFSVRETLKLWGKGTMESHFLRYHFIKKCYHFVQSDTPQPPRRLSRGLWTAVKAVDLPNLPTGSLGRRSSDVRGSWSE